jgi:hypothetical protein
MGNSLFSIFCSKPSVIKKRIVQARRDGDLAPDVDPGDFARHMSTLLAGLGVQAANGATKLQMTRVADLALRFITVDSTQSSLVKIDGASKAPSCRTPFTKSPGVP